MEVNAAVEVVALISAAVTGFIAARSVMNGLVRKRTSSLDFFESMPLMNRLLLHGIPPLKGIVRRLLKIKPVAKALHEGAELLARSQRMTNPENLGTLTLAFLVFVFVTVGMISSSWICAMAVVALIVGLGLSFSHSVREREEGELRAAIPDVLRSMAVGSKAGLSLYQMLQQTAHETSGVLRRLFEQAARRLDMGETPDEALQPLRQRKDCSELAFVAVALDVQHQCGGSLTAVLDAASNTVEGELELERSLKVQTAQAKLSARIVTLMPFVLIALFTLLSGNFLAPFFSSLAGMALFSIALAMELAGILLVRKLLRVEVG